MDVNLSIERHREAERQLQEERVTLTRFDREVTELEQAIKDKKNAATEADLQLKKLDHDVQSLRKDRAVSASKVHDLETLRSGCPLSTRYVVLFPAPFDSLRLFSSYISRRDQLCCSLDYETA